MDGLADHLAAQGRELLPDFVLEQVVERHPVPAPIFLDERNHFVTGIRKELGQNRKGVGLLRCGQEFEGGGSFHFAKFTLIRMGVKHPFFPAQKDGVSWTIR
jgi:hypothetical protein